MIGGLGLHHLLPYEIGNIFRKVKYWIINEQPLPDFFIYKKCSFVNKNLVMNEATLTVFVNHVTSD